MKNHDSEPIIEFFTSDNLAFSIGDKIKLRWETHNADVVEIKSLGQVDLNGSITFKSDNFNKKSLTIKLIATNTKNSKSTSKLLTLINKDFAHLKNDPNSKQEFVKQDKIKGTEKIQNTKESDKSDQSIATTKVAENSLSDKERLKRLSYIIRVTPLILSLFLIAIFRPVFLLLLLSIPAFISLANEILLFAALILIFAILIVSIKRLHDINLSGWWGIFLLIPLINLVFIFFLFIIDGTKGTNKYGIDPKKREPKPKEELGQNEYINDTTPEKKEAKPIGELGNKNKNIEIKDNYADRYIAIFFKKRMERLKSLNKGVFRLTIVLSLVLPFFLLSLDGGSIHGGVEGITFLMIWFILYWIVVFLILWVYDGFKEGQSLKK